MFLEYLLSAGLMTGSCAYIPDAHPTACNPVYRLSAICADSSGCSGPRPGIGGIASLCVSGPAPSHRSRVQIQVSKKMQALESERLAASR